MFAISVLRLPALAAATLAAVCAAGSAEGAQEKSGTAAEARGKAVEKIMAQIEQVQLAPLMTARDLFDRLPKLRRAARDLVAQTAAAAPVAAIKPAGYRVDVSVPGDRLQRHLEEACTRIELPRDLRSSLSLGGFARGRIYRARGEAGGVPLPKVWRAVGQRGRDLAAGAARLQAIQTALVQIATAARNRGLTGADRLATLAADTNWVREHRVRLVRHGASDVRGAQFLDDGTCRVIVQVPSAAWFRVLDDLGRVPGLPGATRAALAKSLGDVSGTGVGVAKAPENADELERPRVLRAEVTAAQRRAARVICLKRLQDQLYRVRWDERRTVHDFLSERLAGGDAAVRDRFSKFLGGAREVQSRAAPGDQWYLEMELSLDGLEAALNG